MSYIRYRMYTYDIVGFGRNSRNIRYRTKHTTSYVFAKTYDIVYDKHLRHRIRYTFSNVRHRRFWLTYDIIYDIEFPEPTTSYVRRTMSGSTSHVRHRTYDITYDIARTTSYVCQHRRCDIRHRMSDVRYRRFRKIYVVYDVVCQPKPTMSYV